MNPSVIVLVVDRWHIGAVGPYGNTWLSTPELDRLAAQSFLFDQAQADCADLPSLYRGWWHGLSALEPGVGEERSVSLPGLLTQFGFATRLVTDDPAVADLPAAAAFARRVVVPALPVARSAVAIEQTQLYRLFSTALDELLELPQPFLLWVHARGMAGSWDAPYELRERLVDEDDPDPGTWTEPPSRRLPPEVDPDELFIARAAYGGQALLLDACIGWLLDNLVENQLDDRCLMSVQGLRGCPLGEHHRLGPCDEALYEETVHIPWLLKFPDRYAATCRTSALVQLSDGPHTLLDWLGIPNALSSRWSKSLLPLVRGTTDRVRDRVCYWGGPHGEVGIRTPAWRLRLPRDAPPELFLKPDDRWEVNDVANRCPELVEQLVLAHQTTVEHIPCATSETLPPLEPQLLQPAE